MGRTIRELPVQSPAQGPDRVITGRACLLQVTLTIDDRDELVGAHSLHPRLIVIRSPGFMLLTLP